MFGTKRVAVGAATIAVAIAVPAGALADSTGNHGQPNQSCEVSQPGPPGFSTAGFANAESHYANNTGTPAVAQYDVACFQFSSHHGP